MSGRVIEVNIPYRENGDKKILPVKIDFVSRRMMNDYNSMISRAVEVQAAWERIEYLSKQEQTEDVSAELEEKKGFILSQDSTSFFDDRFNLLVTVLKANGVKVPKFLSSDFWDECVDVNEIMSFLTLVIHKDSEKKNIVAK
jgi:hypothetical protein